MCTYAFVCAREKRKKKTEEEEEEKKEERERTHANRTFWRVSFFVSSSSSCFTTFRCICS
jgi:hypothetical protein